MALTRITEENFENIDPRLLLDQKWYQDVENMVASIDAAATPDYAKEYALLLADKLEEVGDKMAPELLNRYLRLLRTLRLYSLLTVNDEEKEKFLSQQVLDVFRLGFVNVKYWIDFIFQAYYQDPDIIEQLRIGFIRGLESNLQRLGNDDLFIPGQERLHPTLKNWLIDYNQTAKLGPVKNSRGTLEEISYINQSPNVKHLSAEDRNILLAVLKIYDWLRYSPMHYDFSLPGQTKEPDQILEGDQHVLIPEELVKVLKERRERNEKAESLKPSEGKTRLGGVVPAVAKIPASHPIAGIKAPIQTPSSKPSSPLIPKSDFDQKLVGVATPHGQDLEVLRRQIEEKNNFIPPVKIPSPPHLVSDESERAAPPGVKMTPDEIKREISEPELPAHTVAEISAPKPVQAPIPRPLSTESNNLSAQSNPLVSPLILRGDKTAEKPPLKIRGGEGELLKPGLKSLSDIKTVDDLKKIDLMHLRQGSIQTQVSNIKSKIITLAQVNKLLPYYTLNAFEQSPLFKSYLQIGNSIIHDDTVDRAVAFKTAAEKSGNNMTLQEFEFLADLRKELERL